MKALKITGQILAWIGLLAASAVHYIVSLISKGMGYTLPLEQVVVSQGVFGMISLFIAGLFWLSGWRPWQALCVALGTQAVLLAHIIMAFRPEDASPLEWSIAIACLISGAVALIAACTGVVFGQVRVKQS